MLDPRTLVLPPTIRREEYQIEALCGVVEAWRSGHNAVLVAMPTGTGKTITSGLIADWFLQSIGSPVLFIAHRTELIEQAANTYVKAFDFDTAIESGSLSHDDWSKEKGFQAQVVVATIQSLYADRMAGRFPKDHFGLIVVDEAHHAGAKSYQDVLSYFEGAKVLGITATPDSAKRNLGEIFDKIGYQLRLRDAVENGYLVPYTLRRIKVPVDLRGIRTTGGDFNAGDLADRLSPEIERLCYQIHVNIGDRQTVVFCPDRGSSSLVADMLRQMGRKAEYVAGEGGEYGITREVRKERLNRVKERETQVVTCSDLLVEGWDMPSISCVVNARATKKRSVFAQRVGRGLRLCPSIGKTNCLVLDLDWKTDDRSRRLCMAHDLFCSEEKNEAMEILEKRLRSKEYKDRDIDVLAELKGIENDLRRGIVQVHYTGKLTTIYSSCDSTPFGIGKVLNLRMRRGKDFNSRYGGEATRAQVDLLSSMGVENAQSMNLWGASRLISKLKSREKKGLASHQYVKRMLESGVSEEQARTATQKEAASIVSQIILKQGEFF
jgi:superfamily II DNA or RNA helicase